MLINENTNKSDSWTHKYQPTSSSNMIIHTNAITELMKWLKNFSEEKKKVSSKIKKKKKIKIADELDDNDIDSNTDDVAYGPSINYGGYKPNMLIYGNHGIGKTSMVTAVLNDMDYNIKKVDFNFKGTKHIAEILNKILYNESIINISQGPKKRSVILIDEIESITTPNDKKFVNTLLKLNNISYCLPIIFIANNQHNKTIQEIKKKSCIIRLWDPWPSELIQIASFIKNKEGMIMSKDILNQIANIAQRDIRKLLVIMEDLYNTFGKTIDSDMIERYSNMISDKDINIELFVATKNLLLEYKDISTCFKYYNREKVLLPLMIFHNYTHIYNCNIENFRKNKSKIGFMKLNAEDKKEKLKQELLTYEKYRIFASRDKIDTMLNISNSFSIGDVIENYIYGEQNWDMQFVHGFYSCVNPSFIMSSVNNKHDILTDFAADLNKTSIKNINKKNVVCVAKYFNNMNIFDLLYISGIIKKKLKNKDYDSVIEIMKQYKIKKEGYESLLKIDKIFTQPINLTPKQKKYIFDNLIA